MLSASRSQFQAGSGLVATWADSASTACVPTYVPWLDEASALQHLQARCAPLSFALPQYPNMTIKAEVILRARVVRAMHARCCSLA